MSPLLAKSGDRDERARTLVGHTEMVLAAADALFGGADGPGRLGRSWLRFFGLAETDFPRFRRHLRVSAAAHDWGKANDGFQGVVGAGDSGVEQAVRHEHLSGLLLSESGVPEWLRRAGLDADVVLGAVISHHVKAAESAIEEPLLGHDASVRLRTDQADYLTIARRIEAEAGTDCPEFSGATTDRPARWRADEVRARGRALASSLATARSRLRDDPARRRLLAAVRAGLMVADAAGSAVVRMDRDGDQDAEAALADWIGRCFADDLTGDLVWRDVVKRRIADLRGRNRWDDDRCESFRDERGLKPFQHEVGGLGPRVLLAASCGAGKTLAAWNWITTRPDERPAARVLFLYPTRATATEGFRDYVSWAPEAEATLLSDTAAYELQYLFSNPEDVRHGRKSYSADPRLYAIGHWGKRIFSATADQFFPFMQYAYGPLCLLPVLAEAVLVVDEVYSFDASMFATLKRFLAEFAELPVLCMTATLSDSRRTDLERCGLVPYAEAPTARTDPDAEYPRYRIEWIMRTEAEALVSDALDGGRRVLWVSNRVADYQATFEAFSSGDGHISPLGADPQIYCYHSRFKLTHRQKRHGELILAFQDAAGGGAPARGLLGATTQVCEMSLDLDAEVLVTELAPIASLIQRMGRCNRDPVRMRRGEIGRVYVLRPELGKEKPSEEEDLALASEFVERAAGGDISQTALDRLYREIDPGRAEPSKVCPFLDSGPFAAARVESFRETDDFAVPGILDHDVPKVLEALDSKAPIDGYVVPVPRYLARPVDPEKSRLPRWLWIAEGRHYDRRIGFRAPDLRPSEDRHDG